MQKPPGNNEVMFFFVAGEYWQQKSPCRYRRTEEKCLEGLNTKDLTGGKILLQLDPLIRFARSKLVADTGPQKIKKAGKPDNVRKNNMANLRMNAHLKCMTSKTEQKTEQKQIKEK